MDKIIDPSHAMKMTKEYDLNVALKNGKKGTSLYAIKPIKAGNIIAYYKFLIYKDGYNGLDNNKYTMGVYKKNNMINMKLIGDIYEGSLDFPKYNIPFWGHFANEPSKNEKSNCIIDANIKSNYKNRNTVYEGDTMVYKLIAKRNIKPGDEILWYYGNLYSRDYEVNLE